MAKYVDKQIEVVSSSDGLPRSFYWNEKRECPIITWGVPFFQPRQTSAGESGEALRRFSAPASEESNLAPGEVTD